MQKDCDIVYSDSGELKAPAPNILPVLVLEPQIVQTAA